MDIKGLPAKDERFDPGDLETAFCGKYIILKHQVLHPNSEFWVILPYLNHH